MFPFKRAAYYPIEEEDPQQLGNSLENYNGTVSKQNLDAENGDHGGGVAMCESALPPNQQELVVSFKCEKDPEMSSVKDERHWDHVGDVDQFFSFIYEYYQHKGFLCITLRYIFSLFRFAFVVIFSTFLLQCVDYDVLFYNRNVTLAGAPLPAKRRIQDAFIPQCHSHFNPLVKMALFLATLFWIGHFIRISGRLVQFYEIKHFFATNLLLHDKDIQNLTWNQVVQKLCQAQKRIHLIVNKDSISSLDIYQRILRHRNYFVAFVYKSILPTQIFLPFIGRVNYLSSGLRFNLEWLLFWGPWSPWKSSYALKDEFKDRDNLEIMAQGMRRTLAIMSLVNLLFFPFVFIYQVLFSFFSYSELFQRDPNMLGMRKYSNYGREKLRHFNEMEHELDARLNRSYEFAVRYTDQFVSPIAKIIAKSFAFVAASFFVVLCALTAYDEDTLKIEHVTTMMTISGGIVLACRVFIPNEHLVFCQQLLMRQIVANIHYAPKTWLSDAHSTEVYKEFTQLFRLKAELLVEELISPFLTPFILYFCVRPRSKEIVEFFHKHTIHVEGLGDVCSFAQMDISKDGDVRLASINQSLIAQGGFDGKGQNRSSCGKVELSLLNFATQNPDWMPSKECVEFIRTVKELVSQEILQLSDGTLNSKHRRHSLLDAQTLALLQASTNASLHQMDHSQRCDDLSDIGANSSMFCPENLSASDATIGENFGEVSQKHKSETDHLGVSTQSAHQKPQNELPSSSSIRHLQHQPLAYTNSQLIASSFIQPSPLAAIVQPRVIQESNFRALEMSMQALAVNQLLFLNKATGEQQQPNTATSFSRCHPTNNRRGYGSILLGSVRRGPTAGDSLAESNIFGVPAEASQIHQLLDGDQAPLPLNENGNQLH